MKQIRISILMVILVLATSALNAQEFYTSIKPLTTDGNTLNYKLSGRQYYFSSYIRGSAYFNDFWSNGSVILENGDRYDNVSLMLNIFTNELIWFNDRIGSLIILDKYTINEFVIESENSDKVLFRKIAYDKVPKGDYYFNVLYDGDLKLLIWYKAVEQSTSLYRDSYGFLRDKELVRQANYCIMFPDNDIIKIKGNRGSFINLFPDQKKRVRQLFRKNNVNLFEKDRNEIIRVTKLLEAEFFSK